MKYKKVLLSVVLSSILILSFTAPITAKKGDGVDYGRMAKFLPSNGEMFGWIKDIWKFGDEGEFGYRMPGTPAEEKGADYIFEKFEDFGLEGVTKEPIPITVYKPDVWSLTIRVGGNEEEIPCSFFRYGPLTNPEGITADLVYVGSGSEEDFINNDVEGKIVVVDVLAPGWPYTGFFDQFELFAYDPDDTMPGDMGTENWPLTNLEPSLEFAVDNGAVGYVGILTFTVDDNNQFWHSQWDKPLTALTLSPNDGAYLRNLLESEEPINATMILTGYYGPGETHNVYGFLPGKNEDEIILIESHHDGWATNEASGAAAVMALAKYFAHFPKESRERTLMFVAFGSHFAQRDQSDSEVYHLINEGKIVFATTIEMIGKQLKIIDGKYVETGLISPTGFGISIPMIPLIPIISQAIIKYDLKRSMILPLYHGEGGQFGVLGVPTIERIAENAPQFTNDDTPNTVMVSALRPTTAAFVDIIKQVDLLPIGMLQSMS